jgi:hypothetical protein
LQYFAPTIALDRIIGFYGIAYETVPTMISQVRMTLGATSALVRGVFQIEQLNSRLEPAGYFSDAIFYIRQEVARIQVLPRAAFAINSQRLTMFGRTIEPLGTVVSAPAV